MKNYFKKRKAFSLVQLVLVIGLIGILFAGYLTLFKPSVRLGEAGDSRRWIDVENIAKAVELYERDNHQIPSDFSTSTLSVGEKFVLCNSAGTATCDGQTTSCLVVDNTDFIGVYLPSLPVDPEKTSQADTGYYITRTSNNAMSFGACSTYGSNAITSLARASLPAVLAECGDGVVEGSEVCDDGDVYNNGCGNGIQERGNYCNDSCSAVIVLNEACDSNLTYECGLPTGYYTGGYDHSLLTCTKSKVPGIACNATCTACDSYCFN